MQLSRPQPCTALIRRLYALLKQPTVEILVAPADRLGVEHQPQLETLQQQRLALSCAAFVVQPSQLGLVASEANVVKRVEAL